MLKKLLLTGALAITSTMCMQAQLSNLIQQGQTIPARPHVSNSTHHSANTVATVNCVDTNYYVYLKDYILNTTANYVTFPSNPNTLGGCSLGYSYSNTGTITVTGLGFIAASGNTAVAVPAIAYLYNVNGTGQPTTKIDSMTASVTTGKFYYGTLISAPRTLTTNFAVVFKLNSSVATQTLAMYMTPAQTGTATVNKFGEGRGYINAPGAGGWFTASAAFTGTATPTADYEPIAFPIYSYNMAANYTVTPTSPICITSTLANTNTSVNTNVPENYMFNFARMCKKWNIATTGLDSIYTWNFSDGTGRFKAKNQNHVYTAAGTYNDSLIYTNNAFSSAPNCVDKKITSIVVVAQPTVVLTPAASTVCTGATATISASGATTYAWQGGQSTASATFAPSSNSIYSVTGTNACGTSTATANVGVTSVAVISAVSSSSAICAGQSSTLTVSGATTYTWNPSATLSSANGPSVTATPTATGNTTYTITGTSTCGTATTTLVQNVKPNPTLVVNSSTTAICSGSSATLTASGATTYSWMPAGGSSAAANVNPTSSTVYTVMGTTSGCSSTGTVSLGVNPTPTVTAMTSSSVICLGSSVTLSGNTNGTSYLWSNAATTLSTTVTPTATSTYSLGVSIGTCYATSSIMVTVNPCTGIDELTGSSISVYPNPNTGVLNISISSELATTASVEVYDAIGKLMITQSLNNEHTVINTSNLSNGVYIYKILNSNNAVKVGRIVKQ